MKDIILSPYILERVALVICKDLWAKGLIDMELPPEHFLIPATVTATTAITAFLEAAAKQGWQMRPDEATKEMLNACPQAQSRNAVGRDRYRAMLTAAPKFEG